MDLSSISDNAVEHHTRSGLKHFAAIATQLGDEADPCDRLQLLNDMVLLGPSYKILEDAYRRSYSRPLAIVESSAVQQEISVLQDIPESYCKSSVGTYIELEIERLVSPATQSAARSGDKLLIFLQASTDVRLISFGRLINHILNATELQEVTSHASAEAERGFAFALFTIALRFEPFSWDRVWDVHDPLARLIAVLALQTAHRRGHQAVASLAQVQALLSARG